MRLFGHTESHAAESPVKLLFLLFPFLLFSIHYKPNRAPIAPYISGDTFRANSDHAFDEMTRFSPFLLRPGQTIFVKPDMLEEFFTKYHPQITTRYILVTHNSDNSVPGPYQRYLEDDKIIAWFGQNPDIVHPKLHPIPIGLENRNWKPQNVEVITRVKAKKLHKTHLLYYNLNPATYPSERTEVQNLFAQAPFTYAQDRKEYEPFIEDLASSKFVLSPRGNGLDTHRLWETLYVGSYPIVKTSPLDSAYEGLPVVIVSDWSKVTEEFLNQKYDEFQSTLFNYDRLNIHFWLQLIKKAAA